MESSDNLDGGLQQQVRINNAYDSFKHNASLTMLVLAPVLIAIPPRKLDLYTFSLTGAFIASVNHLTVERTGKGIISQFGYGSLPTQAVEVQRQLAEDKERKRLLEEKSALPDEVMRRSAGVKESIEEKVKEVWIGGEPDNWKEKRLKEEQEKLNQGEGYGGMIMDQIWEVWNWSDKRGEQLKANDEEVLQKSKKP